MTDSNSVILEKRGQAFWIAINRPEKRNALNADVIAGIAKGYRDAHDDKDVRVIVLTGAGDKAFCAGADLQNSGAAFAMDFSRPMSTTPICCGCRRTQPSLRSRGSMA